MKSLKRVQKLTSQIEAAKTPTEEGRNIVAKACRELYYIIEDTLDSKYGLDAVVDAYNDLLNGDFAEPFHCETKKQDFRTYKTIFEKIA